MFFSCPNYLSPEVVLQGLNPLEDDSIILSGLKADIWSLGIILLEVLMVCIVTLSSKLI